MERSEVTIEEFKRLDLRVGKVVDAKRVEGTRRLLVLEVDLGRERRQVVAGIAEHYDPSKLVGKNVVLLANLRPKRIRGLVSQGMILAAVAEGIPVLITTDREVPPGTPVE